MAVSREVLGIAATAVATLLVAICSIPAGASHFGRRKYRPLETETTENADSAGLYRDQDGVAKEPSSRPGFFSPMSLLIGSVCMGIGATVAGILVGREFSTFTWHYVSGGLEASAWVRCPLPLGCCGADDRSYYSGFRVSASGRGCLA